MRSIVAALIVTAGLILPVATPAVAQESPPQFRVVQDTVLSLHGGEHVEGTFQLEGPARLVFAVQPYVGDDGLFLDVWFGKDGKGYRSILYDHSDVLLIDEVFSTGTIEYSVKADGNPRVLSMPDHPPQRALLLIRVYPPQ
jgi:hypothetical protein